MTATPGKITPEELHSWLAKYLPALTLIIVALVQFSEYTFDGVTPWKRGGFGMFTTVDAGQNRGISCIVTDTAGAEYTVLLEKSLFTDSPATAYKENSGNSLLTQYLKKPAQNLLKLEGTEIDFKAFAAAILANGRIKKVPAELSKDLGRVITGTNTPQTFYTVQAVGTKDDSFQMQSVTLQLWRRTFDPASATFRWLPLRAPVTVGRK